MNFRDLTYLVAVVDLQNFTKAADRCAVSQPTLSNQIKKLEDYLGVSLFERNNKKVMPTEACLKISQSARLIINETDAIKDLAALAKDPFAYRFSLGAFPTLANYIFPSFVNKVVASLPQFKPVLIEDKTKTLLDKLLIGELDAALIALPVSDEKLSSRALFDDDFFLAVSSSHVLADKKEIAQEELAHHKLLLLEEGHCMRYQALDICQRHKIEEQDFRASSMETLQQMVKAGMGITLVPKLALKEKEPGICYVPFKAPAPKRTIGLVWRKSSLRVEAINAIIALLSANYGN